MTVIGPCWLCDGTGSGEKAPGPKPLKRCPVCRGRGYLESTEDHPPMPGEAVEDAIARAKNLRRKNGKHPLDY